MLTSFQNNVKAKKSKGSKFQVKDWYLQYQVGESSLKILFLAFMKGQLVDLDKSRFWNDDKLRTMFISPVNKPNKNRRPFIKVPPKTQKQKYV